MTKVILCCLILLSASPLKQTEITILAKKGGRYRVIESVGAVQSCAIEFSRTDIVRPNRKKMIDQLTLVEWALNYSVPLELRITNVGGNTRVQFLATHNNKWMIADIILEGGSSMYPCRFDQDARIAGVFFQ